jgi:hypothetical protein
MHILVCINVHMKLGCAFLATIFQKDDIYYEYFFN